MINKKLNENILDIDNINDIPLDEFNMFLISINRNLNAILRMENDAISNSDEYMLTREDKIDLLKVGLTMIIPIIIDMKSIENRKLDDYEKIGAIAGIIGHIIEVAKEDYSELSEIDLKWIFENIVNYDYKEESSIKYTEFYQKYLKEFPLDY